MGTTRTEDQGNGDIYIRHYDPKNMSSTEKVIQFVGIDSAIEMVLSYLTHQYTDMTGRNPNNRGNLWPTMIQSFSHRRKDRNKDHADSR